MKNTNQRPAETTSSSSRNDNFVNKSGLGFLARITTAILVFASSIREAVAPIIRNSVSPISPPTAKPFTNSPIVTLTQNPSKQPSPGPTSRVPTTNPTRNPSKQPSQIPTINSIPHCPTPGPEARRLANEQELKLEDIDVAYYGGNDDRASNPTFKPVSNPTTNPVNSVVPTAFPTSECIDESGNIVRRLDEEIPKTKISSTATKTLVDTSVEKTEGYLRGSI